MAKEEIGREEFLRMVGTSYGEEVGDECERILGEEPRRNPYDALEEARHLLNAPRGDCAFGETAYNC